MKKVKTKPSELNSLTSKNSNLKNYSLIIIGSLIVIYTIYIFSDILQFDFLNWDDDKEITNNSLIKKLNWHTFEKLYNYDRHTSLTLLTYAIDYKLWGLNSKIFHLNNLVLHIINSIIAFYLSYKITKNKIIAIITFALFSFHPMRVESVAWVVERKDLLYSFFFFLSTLFYIKYLKNKKNFHLIIVFLFSLFSTLSKIQGLTIPVVLFLLDRYYKREVTINVILEKILLFFFIFGFGYFDEGTIYRRIYTSLPAFLLIINTPLLMKKIKLFSKLIKIQRFILALIPTLFFIGYSPIILLFVFSLSFVSTYEEKSNLFKEKILSYFRKKHKLLFLLIILLIVSSLFIIEKLYPLWKDSSRNYNFVLSERIFFFSWAFLYYFIRLFYPFHLTAINPYPKIDENGYLPLQYYISLPLFIMLLYLSYIFYKKYFRENFVIKRLLLFFLTFYLINIFLVLHIIPIHGRLIVGDRYTYLSYFGLFNVLGIIISYLIENIDKYKLKKILLIMTGLLIFVLGLETKNRTKIWENSLTLFNDVIQKNENISFAYNNRGAYYLSKKEYQKAKEDIDKAIQLDSTDAINYYNRGLLYFELGNVDKAIEDFQKSIRLSETALEKAISYNDLAMCWFKKGEIEKSYQCFDTSISLIKNYAKPYGNRGWVKFVTGDTTGAIVDYIEALKHNPDYSEVYGNLGFIKLKKLDLNGALREFTKAISTAPDNPFTYNNRGWVYFVIKDYNSAIKDFHKAISLKPDFVEAYMNLGYISFYREDYDNSIKYYSEAIKYDKKNSTAYSNRGWSYYQKGKYDEALKDITIAISLNDTVLEYYYLRAMTLLKLNKMDEALNDADKLFSLSNLKNDKNMLLRVVEIYKLLDKKDMLCKCYEKLFLLGNNEFQKEFSDICKRKNIIKDKK